jgi:catechol 2,3-dioxygenase-like lactoylglutathione lyase family enzyme
MMHRGFNHVDLATKDMQATTAFYSGLLGFPVVRTDLIDKEGVGVIQHVFFDVGCGQMIAFASGEDAPGYPKDFDTCVGRALGLSDGIYHFAFEAGSVEELEAIKVRLETAGVAVRGPEDHEGWCRSIYFRDPNDLIVEYCCQTRELTSEDAVAQVRFRVSAAGEKLPAAT